MYRVVLQKCHENGQSGIKLSCLMLKSWFIDFSPEWDLRWPKIIDFDPKISMDAKTQKKLKTHQRPWIWHAWKPTLYIVTEGAVQVWGDGWDKEIEAKEAIPESAFCLGEVALFYDHERTASVKITRKCKCYSVNIDQLVEGGETAWNKTQHGLDRHKF